MFYCLKFQIANIVTKIKSKINFPKIANKVDSDNNNNTSLKIDLNTQTPEEYKKTDVQDDNLENNEKNVAEDVTGVKEDDEIETKAIKRSNTDIEMANKIYKKIESIKRKENSRRVKKRKNKRSKKESNKNKRKKVEEVQDSDSYHTCIGAEHDYPMYFNENDVIFANGQENFQDRVPLPKKDEIEVFEMLYPNEKSIEFSRYSDVPDFDEKQYYHIDNARKTHKFLDHRRLEKNFLKVQERQNPENSINNNFNNDHELAIKNVELNNKDQLKDNILDSNSLNSNSKIPTIEKKKPRYYLDPNRKSTLNFAYDKRYMTHDSYNSRNNDFNGIYDDKNIINTNIEKEFSSQDLTNKSPIDILICTAEHNRNIHLKDSQIRNHENKNMINIDENKLEESDEVSATQPMSNPNHKKKISRADQLISKINSPIQSTEEMSNCRFGSCETCLTHTKLLNMQEIDFTKRPFFQTNKYQFLNKRQNSNSTSSHIHQSYHLRRPGIFPEMDNSGIRIVPLITKSNPTGKSLLMESYYKQKLIWLENEHRIIERLKEEESKLRTKKLLEIQELETKVKESVKKVLDFSEVEKKCELIIAKDKINLNDSDSELSDQNLSVNNE